MKIHLYFFFFFFLSLFSISLKAQNLINDDWIVNGTVNDIVKYNSKIYIGGSFNYYGPNTGNFVILDLSNGLAKNGIPQPNGDIMNFVADEQGGYYICGNFTKVGNVFSKYIAYIRPDRSVMAIEANPDNFIRGLHINGNKLYLSGSFTQIFGETRNTVAEYDITTGNLTSWNPNVSGGISTMSFSGNILYVGGSFTMIGGVSRNRIAALDLNTGNVLPWNPGVDVGFGYTVSAIVAAGNKIFAGGDFTKIGGVSRNRIAMIDSATGAVKPWNPNANNKVYELLLSGDKLYVGGVFTSIGGNSTNYIAELDTTSGLSTSFTVTMTGGSVSGIAKLNNIIYLGGNFSSVNGQTRKNLAAIDINTNTLTSWNPNPGGGTGNITISENALVTGIGGARSVNGVYRNNIVQVNASDLKPTSWNANPDNYISQIIPYKEKVYLSGGFNSVGGVSSRWIGCVDSLTGISDGWNPAPNLSVASIYLFGNTLYTGGNFTTIAGQPRNRVAAFNADNQSLKPWDPNSNDVVQAFCINGSKIYLAGRFTSIGGAARNSLSALDTVTGVASGWNPTVASSNFNDIKAKYGVLYVAGSNLKAIDTLGSGNVLWSTTNNNSIYSVHIEDTIAYVAGWFTNLNGSPRSGLANVNTSNGSLLSWNPNSDGSAFILKMIDTTLFCGGSFTSIDDKLAGGLAMFGDVYITPPAQKTIKGKIFEETVSNCLIDPTETMIQGFTVVAEPGPYYASSDQNGNYSIIVDTGSYTIRQVIPSYKSMLVEQKCPIQENYSIQTNNYSGEIENLNFGNSISYCPFLTIDVHSDIRRRCFRGKTTVRFCNEGTETANNVQVEVIYPEFVNPISSSVNWSSRNGKSIIYNIGTLMPRECRILYITDSVSCGQQQILGLTQCTKAIITPLNDCIQESDEWDKSSISVYGKCLENIVEMVIRNNGSGNMANSSQFRIYFDNVLGYVRNFKLETGDSMIVQIPSDGSTIRLEADQNPFHPGKSRPRATIEGCGDNYTTGFFNQVFQDDQNEEIEYSCMTIIGSYDPNFKTNIPTGLDPDNRIQNGTEMEYTIHFQNVGTDTAFTVLITDTLASELDISTFRPAISSHPYEVSIQGKGRPVLQILFPKIKLPDSTTNERESNGYILYKISPLPDLPAGTLIKNNAAIYFDYNDPIFTNETLNTINDEVATDLSRGGGVNCSVYGTNTITACSSYLWINGVTYTESNNTATHTLIGSAANGCDSIITLNLTINYSNTGTDIKTACDSYTWIDGITYTSNNNTATFVLTNQAGCDSTVTLNLTINYSNTGTDVKTACDSYTWIDGITYTSNNNTATFVLTNQVGCDSTVTLNLTLNSNTGIDVKTACDSYTWIDGITYTSSNNTATYTSINQSGCDSIITLNLTIPEIENIVSYSGGVLTTNAVGTSYQWIDCDNTTTPYIFNETSQSYTPLVSGNFSVEVTHDGCTFVSSCKNVILTGIHSNVINTFSVFPNPATDQIFLETPQNLSGATIRIISSIGFVLQEIKVDTGSNYSVDISSYPKGLYLLEVKQNGNTEKIKFIKN